MKAISYTLTLQEPLLAPALSGDPNSAVSYPFIPGSLVRGAIIARCLNGQDDDRLAHNQRLFFDGKVRFLNAYPLIDKARSLPVPFNWQQIKGETPPATLFNGLQNAQPDGTAVRLEKVKKPFCRLNGQDVVLRKPERQFQVHTRREDRVMGRATEIDGAVFRYEALSPGQTFAGVVLVEDEITAGWFAAADLQLGASRSTAYGLATFKPGEPAENWREVDGKLADVAAKQNFTLTLLSDLIVQDENGQYVPHLTEKHLQKWLGAPVFIVNAFTADSLVGGFNRKWGLPLPQVPVIRAGSVFVLKAGKDIPAKTLQDLEWQGVGQRRAEGFGRIAFNWANDVSKLTVLPKKEPDKNNTGNKERAVINLAVEAGGPIVTTMARRLLAADIDPAIAGYVKGIKNLSLRGISPSQIARLRVEIRRELSLPGGGDPKKIVTWLDDLKPTARKQFEKARVGNISLLDWLKNILQHRDPFAELPSLKLVGSLWERLPEETKDRPRLVHQTTLQMVDAVLARLAKEAKKEAQNND